MLELINRARLNPSAELQLLLNSSDPGVQGGINFFKVNKDVLASQWQSLQPVPPLAWNANLATAALTHSQQMLAFDQQSHQLPGEPSLGQRALAAGYDYAFVGENVYASADSPLQSHAAFLIDWGNTATGIQQPPGHRDNTFAPQPGTDDPVYTEIGISIVDGITGKPNTGPLLITQDLGSRQTPGNPFLLGVVYTDTVKADDFYTVNEGLAGLTVTAVRATDSAVFTTTTLSAGGYQLAVPAGPYTVTVSGPGLPAPVTRVVSVAAQNVKQDFVTTTTDNPGNPNPGTADLTASFVGRLPAVLKPGQKGSVKLRLTNAGSTAFAGTVHTNFYFSTDPVLDASDYLLKNVTAPASIAPKRFRDVQFRFDAPLDLADGTYYLIAADATDPAAPVKIAASAAPTRVAAPTTNLQPTFTGRLKARNGSLPVLLRIRNVGTYTAAGTMTVTVAAQRVDGGADTFLLLKTFGPGDVTLRAGASVLLRNVLTLPPTLAAGAYRLVVNMSSTLSTPESNTADNTAVSASSFTVA
jgi:hypothetical protein